MYGECGVVLIDFVQEHLCIVFERSQDFEL